jgi:hypothetical protein
MRAKSSHSHRKGSAMAAIEIECGKAHTEKRMLSFSEADRDRIVQNFPDTIEVSGAVSGGQEFALRPYIKTILDQVQPPTLKIGVAVRGDADDLDSIEIDDIQLKVTGNTSGTFKVADVEISYAFDADILPSEMSTQACECKHGEGRRRSRTFKCTWDIEISIEPGIGGIYEIEEFEITVTSPCDCSDHEFEEAESEGDEPDDDEDDEDDDEDESDDEDRDDDDDDDKGKGKSKKKSGMKKAKKHRK